MQDKDEEVLREAVAPHPRITGVPVNRRCSSDGKSWRAPGRSRVDGPAGDPRLDLWVDYSVPEIWAHSEVP